ncbi:hypothetical protein [Paenibacillus paeoniae]|uniref:Uncharacterized protein n=1 Tax=Paenibacillus paeoniae TaxID=2292705 RepID=A0A371PIU6_9BACL|nr:hypothetical protein [Paenibacillus paeoniae]REK76141.1 hypothetical protein DX130_03505 [Paenibacillus paeoniae]
MEKKMTSDEARFELLQLLGEAGREQSGLLPYLEELEKKCKRLEDENRKYRDAAARRASSAASMNSRLKDALRE